MRASLHVEGVEVELQAVSGPLESLVLHRYWGNLGLVRRPALAIDLRVATGGEVLIDPIDVRGPAACVGAAVPVDGDTLDDVVLSFLTPLLVRASGLAVRGAIAFDPTGAEVTMTPPGPGRSSAPVLVLQRRGLRWRAATTPFGAPADGWPDRRAPLRTIVAGDGCDGEDAAAVVGALAAEDLSARCVDAARVLAGELVAAVPVRRAPLEVAATR